MSSSFNALKRYLYGLGQQASKLLVLAFGLLLLSSFTEGIGILMLVPVVNFMSDPSQTLPSWLEVIPGFNPEVLSLEIVLALFLCLLLVRSTLVYFRERVLTLIRLQATDKLRKKLFETMLFSDWQQRINSEQHQELEQLTNGVNRVGMATFYILKLATTAIFLIVYSVVSIIIAPIALLIAIVVGGIILLLFRHIFRQAAEFGTGLTNSNKQLYQRVMFFLNGMKTVKACAYEAQQLKSFEMTQKELRDNQLAYQDKTALQQLGFQVITALLLCVLVFVGLKIWLLGVAELVVLIVMFSRMMPMLSDLQSNTQRLLHMLPAYIDIEDAIKKNQQAHMPNNTHIVQFPRKHLALQGVSFAYQTRSPLLSNINIEFPLHKITLIKGPSGQGKTTVIDILTSLLTPSAGKVMLDGNPLDASAHHSWRQQVSYLSQEPFLFHASVRDNILWGECCTDSEIYSVLSQCCADFVSELPHRLDTMIGDGGIQLSGGQRQRLVLARALVRKRPLLILDEATNALDSETEKEIFITLQRYRNSMTIVLVSHSEQAQTFADKTVLL